MATTFKLRRKLFFMGPNGEVITGAEVLARKKQMNSVKNGKGTAKGALDNLKAEAAKNTAINDAVRSETRALNKIDNKKFQQMGRSGDKAGIQALKNQNTLKGATLGGYKAGFNAGKTSVGIKQGAINTWNRMGKVGKAGTIAGGAVAAGLMAKGLFGGRKKD